MYLIFYFFIINSFMFTLPNLPFEKNALEPYISSKTLDYHYDKHHQTYVNNLNKLIIWTEYENMKLKEIIKIASWPIFNNAAQIWNHTFFGIVYLLIEELQIMNCYQWLIEIFEVWTNLKINFLI